MKRDVALSGGGIAFSCFIQMEREALPSHFLPGNTHILRAKGRGQLEKVKGFQLYVEGFWVWEFRGRTTSLVSEFRVSVSSSVQREIK